jgi:F-type H+-transporting ATPase subunit delta
MAQTKEIKVSAKKLFDRQRELLEQVPPNQRENLRLMIFLSIQTCLELMKLVMTTGNTAQANRIIDELEEMMKASLPKVVVKVKTAVELSPDDEKKLTDILEKELAKEIILKIKVDNQILGGLILEYEGKTIDLTVNEQLSQLKQYLLAGLSHR